MSPELPGTEYCLKCSAAITKDQNLCQSCGVPTRYMSFVDRNAYEVEQFKAWQESVTTTA